MGARCLLYYITDRSQFGGDEPTLRRALLAKIAEATRAGIDYIQLREKDLDTKELEVLAREAVTAVRNSAILKASTSEIGTRILINSRTDVALAAGADGVHLRADDISPDEVRLVLKGSTIVAKHFLVAESCHSIQDVRRAEAAANFAVFGPVFEKKNGEKSEKTSTPANRPVGIDALREACRATIPVLALGGVTIENAASCLEAGAAGVAGIRLFQDNKIEDVVRALRMMMI